MKSCVSDNKFKLNNLGTLFFIFYLINSLRFTQRVWNYTFLQMKSCQEVFKVIFCFFNYKQSVFKIKILYIFLFVCVIKYFCFLEYYFLHKILWQIIVLLPLISNILWSVNFFIWWIYYIFTTWIKLLTIIFITREKLCSYISLVFIWQHFYEYFYLKRGLRAIGLSAGICLCVQNAETTNKILKIIVFQ